MGLGWEGLGMGDYLPHPWTLSASKHLWPVSVIGLSLVCLNVNCGPEQRETSVLTV